MAAVIWPSTTSASGISSRGFYVWRGVAWRIWLALMAWRTVELSLDPNIVANIGRLVDAQGDRPLPQSSGAPPGGRHASMAFKEDVTECCHADDWCWENGLEICPNY